MYMSARIQGMIRKQVIVLGVFVLGLFMSFIGTTHAATTGVLTPISDGVYAYNAVGNSGNSNTEIVVVP